MFHNLKSGKTYNLTVNISNREVFKTNAFHVCSVLIWSDIVFKLPSSCRIFRCNKYYVNYNTVESNIPNSRQRLRDSLCTLPSATDWLTDLYAVQATSVRRANEVWRTEFWLIKWTLAASVTPLIQRYGCLFLSAIPSSSKVFMAMRHVTSSACE